MSVSLTVLSRSKPGHSETLKKLLIGLVDSSRQEKACLQYDLHQSTEDENLFIFHEIWADEEGFKLHNEQAHILQFREASKDIREESTIRYFTNKIA